MLLIGQMIAAIPEIRIVNIIVLLPAEIVANVTVVTKLNIKLIIITIAMTRSFFA